MRLERPEARNAIGREMLQGLRSAIEKVKADATANVVLLASSVPKVFCAGADLKVNALSVPLINLDRFSAHSRIRIKDYMFVAYSS